MTYRAAFIDVSVKVESWDEETAAESGLQPPRRVVEMHFQQTFKDDAELEAAVAAFSESVLKAARR